MGLERHERYRKNALSYCLAAEKLNADRSGAFIAPISLCLCFSIELFLKSVLLKAGKTNADLKQYGHDLFRMWNLSELQIHRYQARLLSQKCHQEIMSEFTSLPLPNPDTFEKHLEHLGQLHSSASGMALRYPTEKTLVPDVTLMNRVFEELIRNAQYDQRIAQA